MEFSIEKVIALVLGAIGAIKGAQALIRWTFDKKRDELKDRKDVWTTLDDVHERMLAARETAEKATDEKAIESRKLRQVLSFIRGSFDDLRVCYFEAGADGKLLIGTNQFFDITGITDKEIKELHWTDALAKERKKNTVRRWKRFIQSGENQCEINVEFFNKQTKTNTKATVYIKTVFEHGDRVFCYLLRVK